jgi:hypothetical protein
LVISPRSRLTTRLRPVLILDVARYKYSPAWVTASERFNAMNTTEAGVGDMTKGFALIS